MKEKLILILFSVGCSAIVAVSMIAMSQIPNKPTPSEKMQTCFDIGGTQFEYGMSGGSNHEVCLFEKEIFN